jgi:hypothetical protein
VRGDPIVVDPEVTGTPPFENGKERRLTDSGHIDVDRSIMARGLV